MARSCGMVRVVPLRAKLRSRSGAGPVRRPVHSPSGVVVPRPEAAETVILSLEHELEAAIALAVGEHAGGAAAGVEDPADDDPRSA